MANLVRIDISNVGAPVNNVRPATYGPGNGVPAWASVDANGDVNLNKNGQGQPDVDLEFSLPDEMLFDANDPFSVTPASETFEVTGGKGTSTLTVNDGNNDAPNTEYNYTLKLSDGTTLDPKVINH